MRDWIDRVGLAWSKLSAREKRLLGTLGTVAALIVLAFPMIWITRQNAAIEEENKVLREVIATLSAKRTDLKQLAEARRSAQARYEHKTPALGTFLEAEAKKHGLALQEITDDPEKAHGNYLRRGTHASIPDIGLTAVVNLLSGLVTSPYPLAVQSVHLEHFQAGDAYKLKIGVVTYDRRSGKAEAGGTAAAEGTER